MVDVGTQGFVAWIDSELPSPDGATVGIRLATPVHVEPGQCIGVNEDGSRIRVKTGDQVLVVPSGRLCDSQSEALAALSCDLASESRREIDKCIVATARAAESAARDVAAVETRKRRVDAIDFRTLAERIDELRRRLGMIENMELPRLGRHDDLCDKSLQAINMVVAELSGDLRAVKLAIAKPAARPKRKSATKPRKRKR